MNHQPLLFPFLFFLFSFLNSPLSFAASSISLNHSLSGNRTIISQGGKFELGFFQPGGKSSNKYYIAIWFKKVSQVTPVWVANRDAPISDPTSSELKISDDGNLVLLNQFTNQVWSTNQTTIESNTTTAVILDTGNLVLIDDSDPSKIFWQSFDHPTDTLLPGAKFGTNKVTGERQRLTSWKNSNDPSPGIFSLEGEPNSTSLYLVWNETRRYYSTGEWNGHAFTDYSADMTINPMITCEYVSNATVNYFTYHIKDEEMIGRPVLDISGRVMVLIWLEEAQKWTLSFSSPREQCDVYALCGPFGSCSELSFPFCSCVKGFSEASPSNWDLGDHSQGCVRNTPLLQCGANSSNHGDRDKFFTLSGMVLPVGPHFLEVATIKDCELACLNNCSCTAYSYSNRCTVWYGELLNLEKKSDGSTGETLYIRLAASELPKSKTKNCSLTVVVGTVVFIVLSATVLMLACRYQQRRMIGITKAMENNLVMFRYGDLQKITKNFSEKIGGGGFGSVFKGQLPDSTAVAVKKLEGLRQGEKQFRAEVSTIGKLQHVNLVRLRGFCSEGTKKLLVYDYMPNGSLDAKLFRSNDSMVLDWKTRYQIALGAARGLAYLHEKCRDCIIHCDIKPENILLDASFVSKVADFGLAKLVDRDFSRVLTTIRGTIGYLAPEWISGMPVSSKADVYSYGTMLFEIISGRRNAEKSEEGEDAYFPMMAATKVVQGDVLSLLDQKLNGDADLEELDRACKVACWCIQDHESRRPSMGHVVQILEGIIKVSMPPVPRLLYALAENSESIVEFSSRTLAFG